jgi:hypothetical protein
MYPAYRKFIATVSAAAIAITAMGAVPAHADDRDAARALAAILGIAVVGALIHENNKDKKRKAYRQAPVHKPHVHRQPPVYQPQVHNRPQHLRPRPLPSRANRKLLPGQCFRSIDTRQGTYRIFGQRCLNQHYRFVNSLPSRCHYVFRTPNGKRRGYEARCLRDAGYRLARG